MKFNIRTFVLCIALISFFNFSNAQEIDWEKMLVEDVENVNPVYMPVVGLGVGYFNFMGDVKNNLSNPLSGSLAFKANMHTFIDNAHHYKFNLWALMTIPGENGTPLTVNQRDYKNPNKNFRFQTDLLMFGLNAHYDFDHFIKKSSLIRPYISVGAEFLTFSSKADLNGYYFNGGTKVENVPYHYWSDGTIRSRPQSDEHPSFLMYPDDNYETDMRGSEELNKAGNYPQYAFAIPIEAGLDFTVSNRTNIRLSYTFHYAFTDNIDNVSDKNSVGGIKNSAGMDYLGYTSVSLHFDLFSDPKMLRLSRLLLEVGDFDYDILGDEDGDDVLDINDRCFGTPKNVPVDSVGCPFDEDGDGVPDHADKDNNSRSGAIVDQSGIEIPDAQVWDHLNQEALPRDQVAIYLELINNLSSGSGRRYGSLEIPEKFKSLDIDKDNYISFDEVLRAIDAFFDFENELTTQDIYELNDFFFAQ